MAKPTPEPILSDYEQKVEKIFARLPWQVATYIVLVLLCLLEVAVRMVDDPKVSFGQCTTVAGFTYLLLFIPVRALARSLIRVTLAKEPS